MFDKLLDNLKNRIGWSTGRHIIVFESDDWGSIRTRSLKDREEMEADGLDLHSTIFPRYDCLESNDDLERLFEVLSSHRDSSGRPAVFTPMCIVANPDFGRIEDSGFSEYHYETVGETCRRYPGRDRVMELWKEGISGRLFVPGLHGREHLNVSRWMALLEDRESPFFSSFRHCSFGVSRFRNGERTGEYLGAFYSQEPEEFKTLQAIAEDACGIFRDTCGYAPTHFISPNEQPAGCVLETLTECGVEYVTAYKNARLPKGGGAFSKQINWPGKIDRQYGYVNVCRNGGFEPVKPGHDYVSECLLDIENAFRCKKPCVISTHRVNYVGGIEESNASAGLHQLDVLLGRILKRWPDAEFLTSSELGELMRA